MLIVIASGTTKCIKHTLEACQPLKPKIYMYAKTIFKASTLMVTRNLIHNRNML